MHTHQIGNSFDDSRDHWESGAMETHTLQMRVWIWIGTIEGNLTISNKVDHVQAPLPSNYASK